MMSRIFISYKRADKDKVFVSYSRKDYVDESKKPIAGSAVAALLDFLDRNKITYWFDKNGIYSGSEFVEIITDAITDSKRMRYGNYRHQKAFSSVTRCYVTHLAPTSPHGY